MKCNIVVCELLAFVQNKLDVMNEEDLVRICESSFTKEDIEISKNLLFDSISTDKRKIVRKQKGKSQRDLADVISIFKVVDPELVPIFVAKDLHKLPPVTFDHIDATRLLKDILLVQNEVRTIKNSYVTVDQVNELKKELTNLQKASIVNNFENDNINRKRGGGLMDSYCLDSGPMGLPHFLESTADVQNNDKERSSMNKTTSKAMSLSRAFQPPTCVSVTPHHLPKQSGNNESLTKSSEEPVRPAAVGTIGTDIGVQLNRWPKLNADVEVQNGSSVVRTTLKEKGEWTEVKRKKRNKFLIIKGKAECSGNFKAADVKIPLFINRVNKQTTEEDIIEYINSKTQCSVTIKKINMKQDRSYSAYKVFVPQPKLSLFLNEELWPEGVTFRRFVYINKGEQKDMTGNVNNLKSDGHKQ